MTTPNGRLYPPRSFQMTLNLMQEAQEAAIVLGAKTETAASITPGEMAAWRDAAWAAFRTLISNGTTCTGATVRATHQASGNVYELGAPPTPAGASSTGQGLAAASTLIKWATAQGGRSGKGRTYLPGLPTSGVAPGGRAYASTHASATATAITNYLTASAFAGELSPAVLSFTKGEAYEITSGAISPVVGVQRRRMR